jgi:hypothetical protein
MLQLVGKAEVRHIPDDPLALSAAHLARDAINPEKALVVAVLSGDSMDTARFPI